MARSARPKEAYCSTANVKSALRSKNRPNLLSPFLKNFVIILLQLTVLALMFYAILKETNALLESIQHYVLNYLYYLGFVN